MDIENKYKISNVFNCVLSVLCCAMILCIIFINKTSQIEGKEVIKTITDTVVVIEEKKVEKIVYKEVKTTDTLYLPTPQDTTALPIEQKHYQDSISDIYISGYQPKIDSIQYHIPYRTIYVDKVVEVEKHKSFFEDRFVISAGVYAGYGIINKQPDIFVGLGVGIRLY